jgi:hypothetical protein
MKASRRWLRRNVEQRSKRWGTAAVREAAAAHAIEAVPRSVFGRVQSGDDFPVAWFSAPGRETMEVLEDGTTRPASWRKPEGGGAGVAGARR